ncbi:MAG: hypothetical protein KJ666_15730 [Bacteroidetes bacterium]|nr:hypothetical protein [Bacteroidota bacterium]
MTFKKILSLIFVFTFVFSHAFAQEFTQEQMEAAQKAWMEYMTPSATHEHMAKNTGEWISSTYGDEFRNMVVEMKRKK